MNAIGASSGLSSRDERDAAQGTDVIAVLSRLSSLVRRVSVLLRTKRGRGVRLSGAVWVHGGGTIEVRDRAHIDGSRVPIELHAEKSGSIIIGEDAEIGGGTSIEATAKITIGDGAKLGQFCKVIDNHFHEMRGDRHVRPPSQPVEIGEGAVLGDRVILLPGARVARGQIVPPDTVRRGRVQVRSKDPASPPTPPRPARSRSWRRLSDLSDLVSGEVARLRAMLVFQRAERGRGVRVRGGLQINRAGGLIRVGARATFLGGMIPTLLNADKQGRIVIGERCIFNYGTVIDASAAVSFGAECMIGSMVVIRDHDDECCAPIVIDDRVWLGHGVVVKPGVRIGAGSVVAAGSIVAGDIPPDSLASGRPARFVPLDIRARRQPADVPVT